MFQQPQTGRKTVQYSVVQHTVQYIIAQHSTVQRSVAQQCYVTINSLHNIIPATIATATTLAHVIAQIGCFYTLYTHYTLSLASVLTRNVLSRCEPAAELVQLEPVGPIFFSRFGRYNELFSTHRNHTHKLFVSPMSPM